MGKRFGFATLSPHPTISRIFALLKVSIAVANAKIITCNNCNVTLALYVPTERMVKLRAQLEDSKDAFHTMAGDSGFRAWFRSLDAFAIGTGKIQSLHKAASSKKFPFVDCSEGNVFTCPECGAGLSLRECLETQVLTDECGILLDDGTLYRKQQ